jgi:hypothetical protein
VAGAQDAQLFTDQAVKLIAAASGGVPRVVNRICDHCLLVGYAAQRRRIDHRIARQAVTYVQDRRSWPAWMLSGMWPRPGRWLTAMLAIGLAGGAALITLGPGGSEPLHGFLDLVRSAKELLSP